MPKRNSGVTRTGIAKEPFPGRCHSTCVANPGSRGFDFCGLTRIQSLEEILEIPERFREEGSVRELTRLRGRTRNVGLISADVLEVAGDACSRE